ncbi:MAG: hypothetical protein M1812_002854 [Candelaria pacifica]|nr:MAG: hypothetical protein M1812_002854 [Candelaria pacifica]
MSESFISYLHSRVEQLALRASESRTDIGRLKALVNVVEAKHVQYEVELTNIGALLTNETAKQGEVNRDDGIRGFDNQEQGESSPAIQQPTGRGELSDITQSQRSHQILPSGSPALLSQAQRAADPTIQDHMRSGGPLNRQDTTSQSSNRDPKQKQYAKRSRNAMGRARSTPTRLHHPDRDYPISDRSVPTPATYHHNAQEFFTHSSPQQPPTDAVTPTLPPIREIEKIIASLPTPPQAQNPSAPQSFPNSFLELALRGSGLPFTKIGEDKIQNQLVACPAFLRIGSEPRNKYTPLPGQHGAVMLVEGQPGDGDVGEKYTVFRKATKDWEYCGQYYLTQRLVVPIAFWKDYSEKSKRELAVRINTTVWGHQILRDNEVVEEHDIGNSATVDLILEAFLRETNCLRMSWGVLQFIEYDRDFYTALVDEFGKSATPSHSSKTRVTSHKHRVVVGSPGNSMVVTESSSPLSPVQQSDSYQGEEHPTGDPTDTADGNNEIEEEAPTDRGRKRARLFDKADSSVKRRRDERGIRYNVDGADDSSE